MIYKEVTDILPYMIQCYKTEENLYPQFGVGDKWDTVEMAKFELANCSGDTTKYYIVENNNKFVGYFFTYKINEWNGLSSFFIMPEYRNLKFDFFNLITDLLSKKFVLSVKPNNVRAIKFMDKIGAKYYYNTPEDIIFKVGEF